MKELEVVVFTNENYFDILYITLPNIVKYLMPLNIRINVVSNKIPKNLDLFGVNFIETNVEFNPSGSHFRDSMLKAITQIKSDYILFLCDDYLINSNVKKGNFEKLIELLYFYKADFFSFASLNFCDHVVNDWEKVETDLSKFNLDGGILYRIPNNFIHLHSIQPCIWKSKSLLVLLENNDELTPHDLDTTRIKNKKGNFRNLSDNPSYYFENEDTCYDYGFNNLTINYPPLTYNLDDRVIGSDYLFLDYGEILRYGKVGEIMTNTKRLFLEKINTDEKLMSIMQKFL